MAIDYQNINASLGDIVIGNFILPKWDLTAVSVGEMIKVGNYTDKTIHFHGEFGVGGVVGIRGSNMLAPDVDEPLHWFTLTNSIGDTIEGVTGANGYVILEHTLWVSPACTAGDGSTLIECSLFAKKGI